MDDLRAAGHEIVFDWCQHIRDASKAETGPIPTPDADHSYEVLRTAATKNLDGIRAADTFIVLAPAPGNSSTGCWFEMGYAVHERGRRNVDVFYVGPKRGPFWTLAVACFDTWAECLHALATNPNAPGWFGT